MREALGLGAVSALRAEAALLSLLSRGLGFNCLSLSARRLAEVCDMHDAGGPSPAWGPHHPLATAGAPWVPPADREGAQQQQQQQQQQQPWPGRATGPPSCGTGSRSSSRGSRRTRAIMQLPQEEPRERYANDILAAAGPPCGYDEGTHAPAGTAASATARTATEERHLHGIGDFGPVAPATPPQQLEQQQKQEIGGQVRQEEHQRGESHEEPAPHQRGDQEHEGHRDCLQHQQHQERQHDPQKREQRHRQRRQSQEMWERAAALRQEIAFSSIRLPGHPVYEALGVCLQDLHAAKSKLSVLFHDVPGADAAVKTAALQMGEQPEPPLAEENKQQQQLPLEPPGEVEGVWGAIATAVRRTRAMAAKTTTATTSAAAAALGRLAASGKIFAAVGAAVPLLHWRPSAVCSWFAGAPRRILSGLGGRAAAAAAAVATKRGYALSPIQSIFVLGGWLWAPWAGGTATAEAPSRFQGPQLLLQQLLQAATKGWETFCCLIRRVLLHRVAAQQHLQQLLPQWRVPGLHRCREALALWRQEDSSTHRSNSPSSGRSPWASPAGIGRGASTSTCYWSPAEGPFSLSSRERLLGPRPPALTLPPNHHQQHQLEQLQQLEHHQQLQHQRHQQQLQEQQELQLQQQQELRQHLRQQREQQRQQQRGSALSPLQFGSPYSTPLTGMARPPGFAGGHVVGPTVERGPLGPYWRCSSDTGLGIGLGVIPAGEGLPGALSVLPLQQTPPSTQAPAGLRRNTSFRKLSQAAAATRAAAAGAAAAAATASWGAAATPAGPRAAARRGPQRHVSFRTGTEGTSRHTAVTRDNWNAYVLAAAAKRGPGAPQPSVIRSYGLAVYPSHEDTDSCWAAPPMGPSVEGPPPRTPVPTVPRRYSSTAYPLHDDSGSCWAGPPTGPQLEGSY